MSCAGGRIRTHASLGYRQNDMTVALVMPPTGCCVANHKCHAELSEL